MNYNKCSMSYAKKASVSELKQNLHKGMSTDSFNVKIQKKEKQRNRNEKRGQV